ncbi:WG repeat-containing protein [Desertibacillus haloalkaliphilus]|nr:WG repeat-containing protein [Desertibacillus haloalkaliphilus]
MVNSGTLHKQLLPAYVNTKNGKRWGYINEGGRFILKPRFDEANDFQDNGLAIVTEKRKTGLIDQTGRFVLPPTYLSMLPFTEGRAIVMDEAGFKIIDELGRELTQKAYPLIKPFKGQRAIFTARTSSGSVQYGYLDVDGNEVIPAQFENAYDFTDDKALVQIGESKFAIINKLGEVIQTFPYALMMGYQEGLIAYKKTFNDPWGYVDEQGRIVISPQFSTALPFQEGRAVVNTSDGMKNEYGVIDKAGRFIIPPKYHDCKPLGEQRIAVGIASDSQQPFVGSIYAIADLNGYLLTDFIYDHVGEYKEGLSTVTVDRSSFFIDRSGDAATSLPVIPGIGSLDLEGNIIQAHVDHRLLYYNRQGEVVYKPNSLFPLNDQYRIRMKKYNPNKDYLVYYPHVEGLHNENAQEQVNAYLKQKAKAMNVPENEPLDYNYFGTFAVEFFKKDLLVIKIEGYHYPFGAAHGMPYQVHVHIDLMTGAIYELSDLFKPDSDYVKVISDLVEKQMQEEATQGDTYYFLDQYEGIQPNQPFYITEDRLAIYFQPYEIAAYAAGFPTFFIRYEELIGLIDVEGAFWKSFKN